MKRYYFLLLVPMVGFIFPVGGCTDVYSDVIKYQVRTDPIVMEKLGDEPFDPDPPGQFPIMSTADFLDLRNPLNKRNEKEDLVKARVYRDPMQISQADRQKIDETLTKFFGTPARPIVGGIEDTVRDQLRLSPEILAQGSKVYRVQCLHCHGVTGDGRGPTARWINPHPRDYRQGHFKFQSVDQTGGQIPPHRDDLLRVLEVGIEGTAMPSFVLLSSAEREALVSYVIHLSLRGKAEYDVMRNAFEYDVAKNTLVPASGVEIASFIEEIHKVNVEDWLTAQNKRIKVPAYPYNSTDPQYKEKFKESVLRGMAMFKESPELGTNGCAICHIDYGRQSKFRYDEWGTFSRPLNLPQGVYRGGRRPVDLYYRIHSGILSSGMIAFGKVLPENKIWDLVNFVQVLGNAGMRKSMGINID